jgi:hypothetical protein
VIDHRGLHLPCLGHAEDHLQHRILRYFGRKIDQLLSLHAMPIDKHDVIDVSGERDRDVAERLGIQLDGWLADLRTLDDLFSGELRKKLYSGRSKAGLVAISHNQSIVPIVHQKACVIRNEGPARSRTRIGERRLSRARVTA